MMTTKTQKKITWGMLYRHLESQKKDRGFKDVKQFCKDNRLDFEEVKDLCEQTGGFHANEILTNTYLEIRGQTHMPKLKVKP